MAIFGMTGSGKTSFVYRFLQNLEHMYSEDPPKEVLYLYGIHQPLYEKMERTVAGLKMKQGLITSDELDEFTADRKHKLIIIDDMANEVLRNPEMELLFTRGTHHKNISVIFISQNLYAQGKHSKTIALNTFYLVLMKNVRDVSQISILGRQLYPGKSKAFVEAYTDALKRPFGYLIVDTSPHAEDDYRLRTSIFPNEDPVIYSLT